MSRCVQGITVVDSDTKKKVKKLLKADAKAKMDIDGDNKGKKRGALLKGAVQKKMKRKGVGAKKQVAGELAADMVIG